MPANPSIQLGTDGNWAIKEDNLLAYKKDGTRFFNKEFNFTRGSLATFVDKDVLIKYSGVTDTELVVNGNFSDGTNSWTPNTNATLSIDNGKLKVAISGAASGYPSQNITTVVGRKYKITADAFIGTATKVSLYSAAFGFNDLTTDGSYNFTFTATSTSTQIRLYVYGNESYGFWDNVSVKEIQTDVPRIDFTDDTTGHLLLEPQSTNTATYSNDFTQGDVFNGSSDPSLNSSVLTSEQGVAPDGTNTAQKLTDNNDGGTGTIGLSYFSVNLTSGQQSTVSIFVKKDTLRYFVISFANFDTNQEISFDLDTNTINRGSGVITEYGNGWYRCSATFSTTTDTVGAIGFYGTDLANVVGGNLRNGTKSVLIWGLQCEELPYATSYIPTTGATATRLGETANNAGDVNVFNSEEGVLYAEIAALADDQTNRRITISDGTNTNRVVMGYNINTNKLQYFVVVGNSTVASGSYTSSDITQFSKAAIKFKANDFALWVDGVERHTDTSGIIFSKNTLTSLQFEQGSGNSLFFYGKVKNLQVFNKALTDRELEILTIQ